ncbi:MAG: dihydrodipicolinate synthase family protein, partial [Chloroflexi bacterium]|nr:dihydrodipicolinate synthase family protein [Chloroflexota bacterium]
MSERGKALRPRLNGIYTVFLTPFTDDDKLDTAAVAANVDYLIREGVHGIVLAGTYGEYVTLEDEERYELFRAGVKAAAGRVPVVATSAAGATAQVIRITNKAAELGADAAMISAPYGMIEPTETGIIKHFEAIAKGTELPLLLYNNPNITPSIAPALLAKLADIDGYVGIKQGAYTFNEHAALINLAGHRLQVFCGSDQSMVGSLALGAAGVSSTQSNFIPRIIVDTYKAAVKGDFAEARRLFYTWAEFRAFALRAGQPAAAKRAIDLTGRRGGPVRMPLRDITA